MKKSIYDILKQYIGNPNFFGEIGICLRGGVLYKFEVRKSESLKNIEEAWKELTAEGGESGTIHTNT